MSRLLDGTKGVIPGSIEETSLSSAAKLAILGSKLVAGRVGVLNFSFPAASSAVVTTPVLAAAATDTPLLNLLAKGIYTGSVSGAIDPLKVLIRLAGTDNGLPDGLGDEVFGVLTESTGIYTLSLKKSNNTAFTLGSPTSLDFYFVEVFDGSSLPTDAFLKLQIGGVIDANEAGAVLQLQGVTPIQETPSGTINGSNVTFTLSQTPLSAAGLKIFLDGCLVELGAGTTKYTRSGTTITFGTAPALAQTIVAAYEYQV